MKALILRNRYTSQHTDVSQEGVCPDSLKEALIALWDRGSVPDGQISLPAELGRRVEPIRTELAAWAYETGCARIKGKMLEEYLRAGDDLSLWWCSTLVEKHPKVTHNLFAALKLRALELLIEEHDITHVHLEMTAESEPWLSEVLSGFCRDTNRTFTEKVAAGGAPQKSFVQKAASFFRSPPPLDRKRTGSIAGLKSRFEASLKPRLVNAYHRLPATAKTLVRFPAWWLHTRRHLPYTKLSRPVFYGAIPASIVTYFPNIDMIAAKNGRFRSRYWENLHEALSSPDGKSSRINWVFLYFPAPQCSFKEAIALRDRFREQRIDGISFHFLEEFLTTRGILKATKRFVRLWITSRRIEPEVRHLFRFAGSHMDLWPVLKSNWEESTRGWRALERCLMREAFRGYAAWAGPQEWTIFPQENCPWERMLAQSMHEADAGPVYGAQHSTVRPTDFRYFDDPRMFDDPSCRKAMLDLWLCNGTGARDALVAAGMPENRAQLVEALRYLYLVRQEASGSEVPREASGSEVPSSPRLLVVTSFFADETDTHLATLAAAIKNGTLDGWDVVVKPHPYLPVAQRLANLGISPQIADGSIGTYLVAGTVVWASNSTTVALEAAYRFLPVLVQAAEDDVDLCPLQGLPGVSLIQTPADVATALASRTAPALPPDYLALDSSLPRWRKVLGLK